MSIATEISRLQTAKADIKSAIEAKGVTVPSNATLDTYDTYVSQISGGGGTNYLEQYANGTISGAITSAQLGTNLGRNMPQYLFAENANITSIDLTGTGVQRIGKSFCAQCTGLTSVTLPNTVDTLSDFFLDGCSHVTSITLPSSVISTGSYCLQNCGRLTQIICNMSGAGLDSYFAFGCEGLTLVDLSSSVRDIASNCFRLNYEQTHLLEVVLRKTNGIVTIHGAIGSGSSYAPFKNWKNIKLYVPQALKASYEADSNWSAGVTAGVLTIVDLEGSQYE